jgi:hypothetical protein
MPRIEINELSSDEVSSSQFDFSADSFGTGRTVLDPDVESPANPYGMGAEASKGRKGQAVRKPRKTV